jgi:hypothetical protein
MFNPVPNSNTVTYTSDIGQDVLYFMTSTHDCIFYIFSYRVPPWRVEEKETSGETWGAQQDVSFSWDASTMCDATRLVGCAVLPIFANLRPLPARCCRPARLVALGLDEVIDFGPAYAERARYLGNTQELRRRYEGD